MVSPQSAKMAQQQVIAQTVPRFRPQRMKKTVLDIKNSIARLYGQLSLMLEAQNFAKNWILTVSY